MMLSFRSLSPLCVLAAVLAANAASFDTPEDAVRALEQAYAAKDADAAVAALDFVEEGRQMLQETNPAAANDPEIIKRTAKELELEFRSDLQKKGFPNFGKMSCTFASTQQMAPGLIKLSEQCVAVDGARFMEKRIVIKKDIGWRVVLPSPVF
jgi:hypothetical protein